MEQKGCPGFQAAGVICGLKKNGRKDLGLIYSEAPANVAGVFTQTAFRRPRCSWIDNESPGECAVHSS